MLWFGESWGAPVCDPADHRVTPVGFECIECKVAIRQGDQGVMMPCIGSGGQVDIGAYHLDCWLDHVLPHGPGCPRCRGLDRLQHIKSCGYVKHGRDCDCANGAIMAGLGNARTLEEANRLGEMIGFSRDAMLTILDGWRARNKLRPPPTHNPGHDPGDSEI